MTDMEDYLKEAVETRSVSVVKFFLSRGVKSHRPGDCLLHYCVRHGADEILELLLGFIDPNETDPKGRTAIFYADHPGTARLLISHGIDLSRRDQNGKCAHEFLQEKYAALVQSVGANALMRQTVEIVTGEYVRRHGAKKRGRPALNSEKSDVQSALQGLHDRFPRVSLTVPELKVSHEECEDGEFRLEYAGQLYKPSRRFHKTLAHYFDFPDNIFKLFTPDEVFARLAERHGGEALRVTLDQGTSELLGVADLNKKDLPAALAVDVLAQDQRVSRVSYEDGTLNASLALPDCFTIAGDSRYNKRLEFVFPVDGIGNPAIYLGALREVCANGAVAFVSETKTDVIISDSDGGHLTRLLDSYDNGEGFEIFIERLNRAGQTPASLDELYHLETIIERQVRSKPDRRQLNTMLEKMAGNPARARGVTSLKQVEESARRIEPVQCNCAELYHFGTELVTHHGDLLSAPEQFQRNLSGFLFGGFDLENAEPRPVSARDFYLESFVPEDPEGADVRDFLYAYEGQ